ncbi:MAG TPA: hypothetical protein DD001_06705 [Microcoleaceae bacterium UBA10368]|jgi:hypothetical protein|nr:hypothetical protein [Microcoleaceae cyanobacterium UBA10368]HCV31407.1 hypothetical protein [Microcoleaceae cyanobacterium UBA9251]
MNAVIATLGTVLGLIFSLINLTPVVIAQPRPETRVPTSEISLSGDSLRNIQERTVDSDYQQFMGGLETSSNPVGRIIILTLSPSGDSVRNLEKRTVDFDYQQFILPDGFHLKIDRDLEIITTPSDALLLGDPVPPKPRDSGTEVKVKLQLGL